LSNEESETTKAAAAAKVGLSASRRSDWRRFPGLLFWLTVLLCLLVLSPVWQGALALLAPPPQGWEAVGPQLPGLFSRTLSLAAGVVIGCGLLGIGLAWLVSLCDFPGRRIFSWALLLPLAMPAYVLGFMLIGLFDFNGPAYAAWQLLSDGRSGSPFVRSEVGLMLSLILSFYPYVYWAARHAFQTRSGRAIEAARSLGAGAWWAFFRVGLPVAWPWIGAGLALVAMETLGDVGTVTLFRYETLASAVYRSWTESYPFLTTAVRLAAWLLLPALVLLVLEQRLRYRQSLQGPARGWPSRTTRLGGFWGSCAAMSAAAVLLVAFLIPAWQLLIWSVGVGADELDWGFANAAWNSALIAGLGAGLTVISASVLSRANDRNQGPRFAFIARLAIAGYGLPGVALASGLAVSFALLDDYFVDLAKLRFQMELPFLLGGGLGVLMLAYMIRFLALGFGPADRAFSRVTPNVVESAQSLGVHGFALWQQVHFPLLREGLLSAFLLAFVEIVKELPVFLLLRPDGRETLAARVFARASAGEWQAAALPAFALMLLVLAGLLPLFVLVRRAENGHA
jgi:iron(III) transport system permease protein